MDRTYLWKWAKTKETFGTIIIVTTLLYLFLNSCIIYPLIIENFGFWYWFMYYVPKFAPLLLAGVYLQKKVYAGFKQSLDNFSWLCIAVGVGCLITFLIMDAAGGFNLNISFGVYAWSYPAVIEYAFFFVSIFMVARRKIKAAFPSLTISVFFISALGMIYELPVYHNFMVSYYQDWSYPFYFATAIFSLLFLTLQIHDSGWHPTKLFICSIMIFLVHAIIYAVYHYDCNQSGLAGYIYPWIPRLPGALLLGGYLSGLTMH